MADNLSWQTQTDTELEAISAAVKELGYALDTEQPHISGERYLMTKEKLVLLGERSADRLRVVIKVASKPEGREEITSEKRIRDLLTKVRFAKDSILFPKEIFHGEKNGYLFWVSEFVPQEKVFAAYPLEEQFFFIIRAFEEQEAFHASTYEHLKTVENQMPVLYARDYFERFSGFKHSVSGLGEDLGKTFAIAEKLLVDSKRTIDAYCNYLTHTDFAPSNFRVNGRKIYLLDLSSMLFGSKYEGWARFLNWAMIHSPALEETLIEYVKKNRPSEYEALRLMRIYKAGLLLSYYAKSLKKTDGDLKTLTEKRIALWHTIMESFLKDVPSPKEAIGAYKGERNSLRSKEELERQKEFNLL